MDEDRKDTGVLKKVTGGQLPVTSNWQPVTNNTYRLIVIKHNHG